MRPYNVIPGWTEGPDPKSQEENFGIPVRAFHARTGRRNDWKTKTPMSKPGPISAKPLSVLLGDVFSDAYAKQGFAARELVTRWAEIAGPEISAHSEPLKIQWPRPVEGQPQEPATLVLRVEGPMALEIQHASDVILQRVNRFFGWSAVGRLALRQAPLSRRDRPAASRAPDAKAVAKVAESLSSVEDEELRAALARLGAQIKRN
jgi:hypothetical protein